MKDIDRLFFGLDMGQIGYCLYCAGLDAGYKDKDDQRTIHDRLAAIAHRRSVCMAYHAITGYPLRDDLARYANGTDDIMSERWYDDGNYYHTHLGISNDMAQDAGRRLHDYVLSATPYRLEAVYTVWQILTRHDTFFAYDCAVTMAIIKYQTHRQD